MVTGEAPLGGRWSGWPPGPELSGSVGFGDRSVLRDENPRRARSPGDPAHAAHTCGFEELLARLTWFGERLDAPSAPR